MRNSLNKLTEKESIVYNEIQVYRLADLFKKNEKLFYEVCEILPSYVNINDKASLDTLYCNSTMEYLIEKDKSDIILEGLPLIESISHTPTLQNAIKHIRTYEAVGDNNSICSYFQYLNFNQKWQWIYTHKAFLSDYSYLNVGTQLLQIQGLYKTLNDILGETFINNDGWQKFNLLSKREKEIMKMFAEGKSKKDISEQLFISEHTVRTHRKNIMGKIEANSIRDIIRFTQALEIVNEL